MKTRKKRRLLWVLFLAVFFQLSIAFSSLWAIPKTSNEVVPGDGVVNYYAVICGIENYQGIDQDLTVCGDDANDMFLALTNNEAWDANNVVLLTDEQVTQEAVYDSIEHLVDILDADDVFIFYFSGHGTADLDYYPYDEADWLDEYLVTYDGLCWNPCCGYYLDLNQCISDDDLTYLMRLLPTDQYIVFLDACYSGGATKSTEKTKGIGDWIPLKYDGFAADIAPDMVLKDLDRNISGVVITACDADELCIEAPSLENSLFTYLLVEAISGAADANGNELISAEECYDYILPRALEYNPYQTAQLYDFELGEQELTYKEFPFYASIVGPYLLTYPLHTYYHDSRTQSIYTKNEISNNGLITELSILIYEPPVQTLQNWTIRMKHTLKDSFSDGALFDNTGWTIVYQGNINIDNKGWYTFSLESPFYYNSSYNLMIDFSHDNTYYTWNGISLGALKQDIRSLHAYSDSFQGSPLDWLIAIKFSNYVPAIKLTFSEN